MKMKSILSIIFAVYCLGSVASEAADVGTTPVDFNRDIRPILSENCFACHGFDEKARQAELRLDVQEAAYAERDGSTPLKPGSLDSSEVWTRVVSDDADLLMPPADSNLKLTQKEKLLIKAWIEQGAKYSAHWSFIPPKKLEGSTGIDGFVFSKLKLEELKPSPMADRYTLIRRLSFDMTGLPPSADEVLEFVNDKNPKAYERLIDRLLKDPHFGERLALDWLDAARYSDTNGFSIDGGRHIWLWRDWVVHAFNTNKPYGEFLSEQIAGDLMPNATNAQLIATGFQRNNMVTHEGGTIPAENLTNYNADRVKTLGEAVLGLTVGCAQCHDHKFDAITQKDYYSLFAYYNTLSDVGLDGNSGVNPRPYVQAKTVLQTGEEQALKQRIAKLDSKLQIPKKQTVVAWEKSQLEKLKLRGLDMELLPLTVTKISTPNRGAGFEIVDDRIVHITQPSGLAAYDVLANLPKTDKPITGLRVVFHPDENTPGNGWGFGPKARRGGKEPEKPLEKGSFKLTALSVSVGEVPADQVDLYGLLPASSVTANVWQSENRPMQCLDTRKINGWSPTLETAGPVHLTMTFLRPVDAMKTPFLTTQLNFGSGDNLIASRMELFALTGHDDGSDLTPEVIDVLQISEDKRNADQIKLLNGYFSAHAPQTARLRTDLSNAKERLAVLTQEFSTMVMNVAEKPRETFILNRGDYSQPTVKVSMGTPKSLPQIEGEHKSRLALAKWITMPNNPLTARVYVNRIWQLMFGAGIVRTPADFGSQGEWPSHPGLLDWLAVDFVENGWDVKALIKKIALSATYRQSSYTSPELLKRDPQNRLLARGPRYRLPAEMIRDSALKTSGLLVGYLGGPSVNPYTPGDLWREISHYGSTPATAQTFVQDHGEKLYRRSIYTYWKRTAPPPNMAAFDAPNRETCVVSRPTTNTPLQALVMLNDVQFVEAARCFAQKILMHAGNDSSKLQWAFLESLSRPASEYELGLLQKSLSRERSRYRKDKQAARALISVGESLRNRDLPVEEHAAWTQIASTVFNLSETVTRN